jgi:tetratricopeptide (TPR) repeat protein
VIRLPRLALLLLVALAIWSGSAVGRSTSASAADASPKPSASATPEPPDLAIPRLEAKLKETPDDRTALADITGYYLQVNRPDQALTTAQKLLQLGAKSGQTYFYSGYANMQLGHIPQAVSDFENASNLEPTNLAVLTTLADLYLRTNRPADAERVAKRAVTFNKDDKRAYATYGQVLLAEQKYDDARAQFDAAAKLDPKDVGPLLMQADTYLKQNAVALASALYDRALAIDPSSQDALYARAQILAQQHNIKDAIPAYEKLRALVVDPEGKSGILLEEAHLYAVEKMDAEADATYKSAIAQYPAVTETHVAYGSYLASKNDLTAAEAEWQQGLGPNRDNRDALAALGSFYADKKDFTKAADFFKRLTEISPNDPRPWTLLGSVYGEQQNWQSAHDAFRHAYDLTHAPDALTAVGETDLNLRNYKEAQQVFDALDKGAPDYVKGDPRVLFLLAQSYDKLGMATQAKGAYQRFLAYLKPGTGDYAQVRKLIDDIDRRAKPPAPAPAPTPKKTQ